MLEGGSLRCLFTAGVTDVLLEEGIEFSYVNGVSAGTMCGMNYISKQKGRMLEINEKYVHDKRYLSLKNMMKNRQIFNFDFVFGELSTDLIPFDYESFYESPQRFVAVATRCRTGEPEFFEKGKCKDMIGAVQASSSMPVLSRMIDIEGKKYLDGGISLPIAYRKAIEEGYEKVVLVLTRNEGYRKKPVKAVTKKIYDTYFQPLPRLREALYQVPDRYNRFQEEISRLEQEGRIFVIRPEFPVHVSRMEQNKKKLRELYAEGVRVGRDRLEELYKYLEL